MSGKVGCPPERGLPASSVYPPAIQKAVVAQRATKTQYPNPGHPLGRLVSDISLRGASGFCGMPYERNFRGDDPGAMVSNSASSISPASEANRVARWFSHEGARDIFVHYSEIRDDGYRTLAEGETVEYELMDSPKGPQAKSVLRNQKGAAISPQSEAAA